MRLAVCGLLLALSVMVKVPLRGFEVDVGVNVMLTVQVALGCRVAPLQVVEDTAKSPEIATAEAPSVTAVFPLAVTVIVCAALVVPTIWPVKVKVDGERLSV